MELSADVRAFLQGKHFGKLATVQKDGSPHVTPVWYMLEDGKVIVNTTTERVKYFNVRRDPRVALLIDNGYSYVMIAGRARVAEERDHKKDIETLAVRYMGEEAGKKAARERYWRDPRVSLEIIPSNVVADL